MTCCCALRIWCLHHSEVTVDGGIDWLLLPCDSEDAATAAAAAEAGGGRLSRAGRLLATTAS